MFWLAYLLWPGKSAFFDQDREALRPRAGDNSIEGDFGLYEGDLTLASFLIDTTEGGLIGDEFNEDEGEETFPLLPAPSPTLA